ncbi:MAG: MotA/TolQ/ExbB proton channel family protein [Pseudomonadota bacterium]
MHTEAMGPDLRALIALLSEGGIVIVVLALLSLLMLTIIFAKIIQFRRLRVGDRSFVEPMLTAWRRGDARRAKASLEGKRNPLAAMLRQVIDPPADIAADQRDIDLERQARSTLAGLDRHLGVLDSIATLSPLLGLFGTVLGMIEAFQAMQAAGGRIEPGMLAGGISTALVTTAAGLAVAIPASAAFSWFEGRLDALRHDMEDAIGRALSYRGTANDVQAAT